MDDLPRRDPNEDSRAIVLLKTIKTLIEGAILVGGYIQRRLLFLLIDPLLWIVFKIKGGRHSEATQRNYRNNMATFLSTMSVIVSLLLIFLMFDLPIPRLQANPAPYYAPTPITTYTHTRKPYISNNSNALYDLFRSIPAEKIEDWEPLIGEIKYVLETLESDGHNLQLQIKRLQSEFYNHQGVYESTQDKVWSELKDKQSQIDLLKQTLEKILVNEINNLSIDQYDMESLEALFHVVSGSLHTEQVESLIQSALEKYHQDVINTADYALKSRHASILYSVTSPTYYHLPAWQQSISRFVGLVLDSNSPELAISPQTHVGECWSMEGNNGSLGIVLSEPIIIDGITVEYPSQTMMKNNMQHAPRSIELLGIKNYPKRPRQMTSLGTIEYNILGGSAIQTFKINSLDTYKAVLIKIHSNWGDLNYTDIYRIRIHGQPQLI